MSAEFAPRVKAQRAVPQDAHSSRPATRIVVGLVVAFVYVGTLAAAGYFISGAVQSKRDQGPIARANIEDAPAAPQIAAAPAAAPATSADVPVPPSVPAAPESPRASAPVAPVAAPAAAPLDAAANSVAIETPPDPATVAALDAAAKQDAAPPEASAPAVPAATPQQEAALPAATAQPDAAPPPPPPEALDFARRGDDSLAQGDVATARLYYERAAELGDARAAHVLGNCFDPAYLERWGVRGMRGDPAEAARWYRRASALGASDADRDLAALPRK
jgi:hypothetical protein